MIYLPVAECGFVGPLQRVGKRREVLVCNSGGGLYDRKGYTRNRQ
jgi:hypothetical protein